MALSDAFGNIGRTVRFQASVRGHLGRRLAYVALYYAIFIVFRTGDRYLRALVWLKRLGFSDLRVDVVTPEGLALAMDLHTAFDPLAAVLGERDYRLRPGFEPQPGQCVLDAGANIGVYATFAARRVGPEGTVAAFEPHPGNCSVLRENAARNGLAWLKVFEAALDEKPGEAELFVHERAINHSLVRRTGRSVRVRVTTIDAAVAELALKRLDILKIDTEGNVAGILRGARETLKRFRPRIAFEYEDCDSAQGVEGLLAEAGYSLTRSGAIGYAEPLTK
ncbi:FkbM family methyltransferase [bacterium]|nr:MAG: FkbM family methyltransferase [bacterium]